MPVLPPPADDRALARDLVQIEGLGAVRRVAFTDTYRMLRSRISIFVNLPTGSLDRLALQRSLDATAN